MKAGYSRQSGEAQPLKQAGLHRLGEVGGVAQDEHPLGRLFPKGGLARQAGRQPHEALPDCLLHNFEMTCGSLAPRERAPR